MPGNAFCWASRYLPCPPLVPRQSLVFTAETCHWHATGTSAVNNRSKRSGRKKFYSCFKHSCLKKQINRNKHPLVFVKWETSVCYLTLRVPHAKLFLWGVVSKSQTELTDKMKFRKKTRFYMCPALKSCMQCFSVHSICVLRCTWGTSHAFLQLCGLAKTSDESLRFQRWPHSSMLVGLASLLLTEHS